MKLVGENMWDWFPRPGLNHTDVKPSAQKSAAAPSSKCLSPQKGQRPPDGPSWFTMTTCKQPGADHKDTTHSELLLLWRPLLTTWDIYATSVCMWMGGVMDFFDFALWPLTAMMRLDIKSRRWTVKHHHVKLILIFVQCFLWNWHVNILIMLNDESIWKFKK